MRRRHTELGSRLSRPGDVCTRIIASGTISALDCDETPPELLIEFVCASCYDRYRRCTDCGSRFSPRVGTGKWRLKELFADGKRSCSLPHRPLVLEDTTCDTWCGLVTSFMAVGAIPDTMESDSPLRVDFRTAAMVSNDVNSVLTSLVTQDIEAELGIRRYIGIRWHNPGKQERGRSFVLQSQDPDVIARERPQCLMRDGYTLHSYIFAELDIGHSYFARTSRTESLLAQALLVRMRTDLLVTNTTRLAQRLNPFPKIHAVWSFM
ncbi:BZ3500_MvSof-1268-A1-R1_Chr1-2g01352 [Microbotryum saponariae]|uniref:BZ3500_MvSof-1268-A1-R1_Chr1-2g01352 protein n=1 Tax=Microbotryum saponariae TaxID=289078 RepID=A0A2X0MS46_9BASI|nr:BZ3500_MvSof-1268-A1-R1_Chr1-2g01352 [Microbotryum saponariae]SCZ97180.1 BZ3501_MvSof-1269-A2-R1_Chr1-2g00951 [Microbotryum saponariae]